MIKYFLIFLTLVLLINSSKVPDYCTDEMRGDSNCDESAEIIVCGYFTSVCYDFPCAQTYKNPCIACKNSKIGRLIAGKCPRSPMEVEPQIDNNF